VNPAAAFVLLSLLRWLPTGLYMAVSVLAMTARGLPLTTIGALIALHSVLVATLELPTGGLADALGRRTVLIVSGACFVVSTAGAALATDAAGFAACYVVTAVGRALGSGPLEAWYVDAALAAGTDRRRVDRGVAFGHAGEAVGLCTGTVTGGLLPALVPSLPASGDAPLLRWSVVFLAAAAMYGLWVAGVAVLVRSPATAVASGVRQVLAGVPVALRSGLRLAWGDPVVRRVLVRMAAIGVSLMAVEIIVPVLLAERLGSREAGAAAYGTLVAIAFGLTAAGSAAAPLLARLMRGPAGGAAVATIVAAGPLALLAAPYAATGVAGYLAFYAVLGLAGPSVNALLHRRAESSERATVLSAESLAMQAGGALGAVGLPVLVAVAGVPVGWVVTATVVGLGGLLLAGRVVREAGRYGAGQSSPAPAGGSPTSSRSRRSRRRPVTRYAGPAALGPSSAPDVPAAASAAPTASQDSSSSVPTGSR
jgi:hypothetical protein